jgi:hypothetical protein
LEHPSLAAAKEYPHEASFVIVSFNTRETFRECRETVPREASGLRIETFVIDNIPGWFSRDGRRKVSRSSFHPQHDQSWLRRGQNSRGSIGPESLPPLAQFGWSIEIAAHGITNLFMTDASFMLTSAATNPSLTIAANALRVAGKIHRMLAGDPIECAAAAQVRQ